jgi:hypothetical protein
LAGVIESEGGFQVKYMFQESSNRTMDWQYGPGFKPP